MKKQHYSIIISLIIILVITGLLLHDKKNPKLVDTIQPSLVATSTPVEERVAMPAGSVLIMGQDEMDMYCDLVYSKDQNFVYFNGQKIVGADPATFVVIPTKLPGVFRCNDGIYAYDKTTVYYNGAKLRDSDRNTFVYLSNMQAQDKNGIFQNGKRCTVANALYTNDALGFSLNFPASWYVPGPTTDPHFSSCIKGGGGFEIEGSEIIGEKITDPYFQTLYDHYKANLVTKEEKVFPSLIPGAVVTEYFWPGMDDEEGWPHWYLVLFIDQKRSYTIGTNMTIDQYPFLSSFKLVD